MESRDMYLHPIPNKKPLSKDDYSYTQENLKQTWLNGYAWHEREDIF